VSSFTPRARKHSIAPARAVEPKEEKPLDHREMLGALADHSRYHGSRDVRQA
jgi:hypothetical protein